MVQVSAAIYIGVKSEWDHIIGRQRSWKISVHMIVDAFRHQANTSTDFDFWLMRSCDIYLSSHAIILYDGFQNHTSEINCVFELNDSGDTIPALWRVFARVVDIYCQRRPFKCLAAFDHRVFTRYTRELLYDCKWHRSPKRNVFFPKIKTTFITYHLTLHLWLFSIFYALYICGGIMFFIIVKLYFH